uniref:Melanoregulin n=1 Tax=Salarias fasciatus TaxID=181472 RepID=A0A672GZR2_SALFA
RGASDWSKIPGAVEIPFQLRTETDGNTAPSRKLTKAQEDNANSSHSSHFMLYGGSAAPGPAARVNFVNLPLQDMCVCLQEWEKLNYDIHTLRYTRREVRSRWKKILLRLGYQCEVDNLLCVNRQSRFSRDPEHLEKATQLLKQLLDHTSLFPPGTEHQDRYLFVMDRLVSLDSAEEFVRLAKENYPRKDAPISMHYLSWSSGGSTLPHLVLVLNL